MSAQRVLEVPLPENAQPSLNDMELLQTAFQAIVGLQYPGDQKWQAVLRRLEREGWSVRCGLMWHVEARRGRELEEACGKTRDDAYTRIDQTTRAASLEGCP
jgi:hypothetical protein